jgi:transcriptional regulator with XRE-family HTH domain
LLADRLGVKASHVALLENGRRRPSLGLVVKLVTVLGVDGRELLELSYPEVSVLLSATAQRRMKVSRSWHRLLRNTALLSRYRVTGQELEVFEHLGMLGGKLTAKRFLAILLLVRDTP